MSKTGLEAIQHALLVAKGAFLMNRWIRRRSQGEMTKVRGSDLGALSAYSDVVINRFINERGE